MGTPVRSHLPAGSAADGALSCVITADRTPLRYARLAVLDLPPGGQHTFETGDAETIVLPLVGNCTVDCADAVFELSGRPSVFAGPTDFAYVAPGAKVLVTSSTGGRFALPAAPAITRRPARYGPAEQVPVELRGTGSASRQVHNFCTPGTFEADRLIAVEVITPGGNWSSWPPHKHDERRDGEEPLEEIYYFEVAERDGAAGMAYQRVYSSGPDRRIDVCTEVRSGDAVLIPYGYHGPSMAVPGYDLYYLNVMAGPGPDRAWRYCDDPAHGWVRQSWAEQAVDPRLPFRPGRAP